MSWYRITDCCGRLDSFVKAEDSDSALKLVGYSEFDRCGQCYGVAWRASECEILEVIGDEVYDPQYAEYLTDLVDYAKLILKEQS